MMQTFHVDLAYFSVFLHLQVKYLITKCCYFHIQVHLSMPAVPCMGWDDIADAYCLNLSILFLIEVFKYRLDPDSLTM